jgi:hypothetical protein
MNGHAAEAGRATGPHYRAREEFRRRDRAAPWVLADIASESLWTNDRGRAGALVASLRRAAASP